MTTYIALLRAVNLPGHNKVRLSDLRELLRGLGFAEVQSLLQSGNLVFGGEDQPDAQLEGLLERAAEQRLGLATDFLVRTADEWQALVAGNPFPYEAARDPAHLVAMCLKAAPEPGRVVALQDAIVGREVVAVRERELYAVYPDGIGRSRLTAALIERKLGTRGTARNWNTVLRLAELARR